MTSREIMVELGPRSYPVVVGEALRARQAGSDLRGFFVWSLLDNFEWHLGTTPRFGLIRVDFASGQRTWRRSASWYRDRIRR